MGIQELPSLHCNSCQRKSIAVEEAEKETVLLFLAFQMISKVLTINGKICARVWMIFCCSFRLFDVCHWKVERGGRLLRGCLSTVASGKKGGRGKGEVVGGGYT